jgi:hypothetical protein
VDTIGAAVAAFVLGAGRPAASETGDDMRNKMAEDTTGIADRRSTRYDWLAQVALPGLVIAAAASGCASAGKLGEYDFRERTLAVVASHVPHPEILTNDELDVDLRNPVQAALRIGADLVKEVEAARARPRLREAARTADVGGRMMERVLNGMAAELRAVPVDDVRRADFEAEVRVRRFGIDADAWLAPAHFFIESEVILRDGLTGRRIWKGKVKEREPLNALRAWHLSSASMGTGPVSDVITAAALGSLSEQQMAEMLEALADFSADRMLRRFRKGLDRARA